jgi:hypothetical protein
MALIYANIAQAFQQSASADFIRYPLYLQVVDECLTKNPVTGDVELLRHYVLEDQYGVDMPGGTFTEHNAVVSGDATSKNATFSGNDWDYISAGYQSQYNFYQTFIGTSGTGVGPDPLFVRDMNGADYGVLAVQATPNSIIINGMSKSGVRRCGPGDPKP